MDKISISENDKRLLYMQSGGFCQNPGCDNELFRFFETGELTNIIELAHIIGKKEKGARGTSNLTSSERDCGDNIIVLCPTCHTLIDKNPEIFPVELLHKWKNNHVEKIKSCFKVAKYKNRHEVKNAVISLFMENNTIFEIYGPYSDNARTHSKESHEMWEKKVLEKILPNNSKISLIFKENEDFFNIEERKVLYKFYLHVEDFEFNKVSGDKNPFATMFPREIYKILE